MRRTGLLAASLACFAGFQSVFGQAPQAVRPPNVLVIINDEHNASVVGCYGNKVVQTPNIDRLAASGVRFTAAYTNSPLCVPCRLSFTAGKYISRVGAWNNDSELPSADYPSIARVMTAAGYDSILCGKMHYDATRRYGFTEVGGNMNGSHKTGRGGRRDADDLSTKGPGEGGALRFQGFSTKEDSSVMSHDRKVTAGTVKFLSERKPGDKPFFMIAGYLAPHFPLVVPEKYWKPYEGKVAMPVIPPGYIESLPLNYRHLRAGFNMADVPAEKVRQGRELYYGLTTWVDNEIGQVLAALDKNGLTENTVVIFTADHGENIGEHGLWWKNCMFDTAARVPLIVSYPKRWPGGQVRSEACSLVDVVQTIAAIGGRKTPADWNGTSMLGWMDNPAERWKDVAISEYYAHLIASGYSMIRMGSWKYVYHTPPDEKHPAQRELYDLAADPGELVNLASKPDQAERIKAMHAALVKEVGEDPDKIEQHCRADFAKAAASGTEKKPEKEARKEARARKRQRAK